MYNSWIALSLSAARLGWDAQKVIALRLMRLTAGHAGPTEAGLMITEKIAAATEVHTVATTFEFEGGNGHMAAKKIMNVYEKRCARTSDDFPIKKRELEKVEQFREGLWGLSYSD